MPATMNKFNVVVKDIMEGRHNFSADTYKMMLSNTAPAATDTVKADIVEINTGNGYPAGGAALVRRSETGESGGVYKYVVEDLTFTAAGGSIGPFRYIILYNADKLRDSNNPNSQILVGWYDYGQSITLQDGESFTIDSSQTDGLIQLQ
jgi:hypothetical protein